MGELKRIHDVIITPLKRFPDERGAVMHMLKSTDESFQGFGEVYCSMVYPGVIKGWHFHTRVTRNYIVLSGMIRLVLSDMRDSSPSRGAVQEIYMGEQHYVRVTIPPQIWSSFKGIGLLPAWVVDIVDQPHDPAESLKMDIHDSSAPNCWANGI